MSKIFALMAVLLILTGVLVLAVPRTAPYSGAPRPEAFSTQDRRGGGGATGSSTDQLLGWARDLADQANAPLSILFGLISLYYSRRTYNINRARLGVKSETSA